MKYLLFALTLLLTSVVALNAATKNLPGKPLSSEIAFVNSQTKSLNAEYPTPADAQKAGYFRYNNEDDTGAISYADLQWNSATDPAHPQPSQLWYDVKGHLLGADFSVPLSGSTPHLWGLVPRRWGKFDHDHVHYILKTPNGSLSYGHAVSASAFTGAGGNLNDPQAATIVKLGKAKSGADVVKVFRFPLQWDVEIWVTPNPLGAFANTDPLVHPSKKNATSEM